MRNRLCAALALLLALAVPLASESPAPGRVELPAGSSFEVGFSPGGTATALVLKAVAAARESLLVAAYEFTDRDVADALESAAHRGVKVRIVADFRAAQSRWSQLRVLEAAGVPIRLDDHYAISHHKFMVVDGLSVETGSYNYSESAARRNAENVLVVWDAPDLAARYTAEFERLWAESREGLTPAAAP